MHFDEGEALPTVSRELDLATGGWAPKRRVLHSQDFTGLEIERTLISQICRRIVSPSLKITWPWIF